MILIHWTKASCSSVSSSSGFTWPLDFFHFAETLSLASSDQTLSHSEKPVLEELFSYNRLKKKKASLCLDYLCSSCLHLLLQWPFHSECRCFSPVSANGGGAGTSSATITTNANTKLVSKLHKVHTDHLPDGLLWSFLSKHKKLTMILVGKASWELGDFAAVVSFYFLNHLSQTHYWYFPLQDKKNESVHHYR